jgi:hypothetical protein
VDTTSFLDAAQLLGVPARVADIDDPAAAELYERKLVLVRPDGQVCWRGDRPTDDPEALLRRLTGRLEPVGTVR